VAASRPAGGRPAAPAPAAPDLSRLDVPIIAINGAFDSPFSKTHRLWRESRVFENVILPGKTHLTAIAVGGPMPPQYVEAMARFIDMFDQR
jgi:pimeloyl-ACP methyl ester carboxylesterase